MEDKIISYGGQAVIEGVMMRGRKFFAVAMRAPDGSIVTHTEVLSNIYQSKIAKLPFLRGVILLWDALGLGMKALTLSANTQTGEDEKLEGAPLYFTLALSLSISIGLFFLLPAAVGGWTEKLLGIDPEASFWLGNIIEGVVRLAVFILYIWLTGFNSDIKRVYMYHGAEHKTINAFEAGAELTPESVAKFPLEHPRCGTAFLLTLMIVSILVFTLLGPMDLIWRLLSRVLFIPILAGIAVEYTRWTANHLDSAFVRAIIKPNLMLQRLTTREPSLEMLEVSITSFNAMRELEMGSK